MYFCALKNWRVASHTKPETENQRINNNTKTDQHRKSEGQRVREGQSGRYHTTIKDMFLNFYKKNIKPFSDIYGEKNEL